MVCVWIVCLCLEISHFWRGGCLWSTSFPKSSGWPCYDLGAFCIDSASVGFAILPRISTSTSWLHFPWDRRLTAGELCYHSLIPWLHVLSNMSRLFGWELYVRTTQRPILGAGIGCKDSGYLLVGTVERLLSHCAWQGPFKIRKRPRLNRKYYFNRAMIASVPCYNGTIYHRNFCE